MFRRISERACAVAAVLTATLCACLPGARAEDAPKLDASATIAATSDYVYRGVSLRDEKPTPMLYLEARYGQFYATGLLIGTYLGTDALGRGLGHIEADATVGFAPTVGKVDFNFGVKYTGYPAGRDLVVGTLDRAERDFIEPFAGAKLNITDTLSIGATAYWTPDFYYETGQVTTIEGQGAIVLPAFASVQSRFTVTVGSVHSERPDVAAPGDGYVYYNAGIEGQIDQLLFDLRYWGTDVGGIDVFDQRLSLSVGVKLK